MASLSSAQNTSMDQIKNGLDASLRGEFQFEGNAWFSSEHETSLYGLEFMISGLDQFKLPLSEDDTQAIVEFLAKRPGVRGKKKSVRPGSRVLERNGSEIVFPDTPRWTQFVEQKVPKMVWEGLVGNEVDALPTCVIDKLVVHEPGLEPLSIKQVKTPANTFATVLIVLPSAYEGGQIRVSRDGRSHVFDMSDRSKDLASVVSWQAGTVHQIQPVTSGHQVALVCNLIHNPDAGAIPRLPVMDDAISRLRSVLQAWNDLPVTNLERRTNFLVYVLRQEFCKADNHLPGYVRVAAEELGFLVLRGALCYRSGRGSRGYSLGPSKRPRKDIYAGLQIERLGNLDAESIIGYNKLDLPQENIISNGVPVNSYIITDPFKAQYALVLIPRNYGDDVLLPAGGASYLLAKLRRTVADIPTESDKILSRSILNTLKADDTWVARSLLHIALRWKDFELWRAILCKPWYHIDTFGEDFIVSSLKTFGLEGVGKTFEMLLLRQRQSSICLTFINIIQGCDTSTEVTQWCHERKLRALENMTQLKEEDIPMLVNLAQSQGIAFLATELLPLWGRRQDISGQHLLSLIKALHEKRASIPTAEPAWNSFVDGCLTIAGKECSKIKVMDRLYSEAHDNLNRHYVKKYVAVLEVGVITGRLSACSKLCQQLLEAEGAFWKRFDIIYIPFVSQLSEVCRKTNSDIVAFRGLLRHLISFYLVNILGSSSQQSLSKIRKLGCSAQCGRCQKLDAFIANAEAEEYSLKKDVNIRHHIEQRINAARDLVRYETIRVGSPHTLEITKLDDIISAQQWPRRLQEAKEFLAKIGSDDIIAKIMGSRYQDVQLALEGKKAYVERTPSAPTAPPAPPAVPATSRGAVVAIIYPMERAQIIPAVPAASSSRKRKRTESRPPLQAIDLTMSP